MKNVWMIGLAMAVLFSVGSSSARAAGSCGAEWNGSGRTSKQKTVVAQAIQQGTSKIPSSKSAK